MFKPNGTRGATRGFGEQRSSTYFHSYHSYHSYERHEKPKTEEAPRPRTTFTSKKQENMKILGLDYLKNPCEDEVKAAYRWLTRRYHPDKDKDPSAHERFIKIKTAYEELLLQI